MPPMSKNRNYGGPEKSFRDKDKGGKSENWSGGNNDNKRRDLRERIREFNDDYDSKPQQKNV